LGFVEFMQQNYQIKLKEVCEDVCIIAHNEDISQLISSLEAEGFKVEVIRGPYPKNIQGWSPSVLCLVNHMNAWKCASERTTPTIIVEADFVPARGFGAFPFPFDLLKSPKSLGYLYACGPEIWDFQGGGIRGHAGATVAYVLTQVVAVKLQEFAQTEVLSGEPSKYIGWDTRMGYWLKEKGIESYMPYRQYGEHGGMPNVERAVWLTSTSSR
jgi:hypothetical protein